MMTQETGASAVKTAADPAESAEQTRGGQTYRPNVDILEKDDELLLLADIPGVKNEDIDIRFEDGTLTIHAKTQQRQPDDQQYLIQEYGVGDYFRTFRISEAVDASRISADYSQGVLTLHLPKAESVKPRKIEVRS